VLDAVVTERDAQWQLARVAFTSNPESGVWVRDGGHAIGHRVRVRILARDISLALTRHSGTSIQNILPGVVAELANDTHPALALVRINIGGATLVARLTRRSAHDLGLTPGQIVYAQIKAVALIG
jgi:molybdate transport system ATP-binding protein